MKRLIVLVCLFATSFPFLVKAEDAKLYVVYAEGKGFVLVRDGKSRYVDFAAQSPVGMELKAGDTVNLEARSALELQLFPTLTVLKTLASSSFTVKAVYGNGNVDLDVAFGRLRTKTDDRLASGEFLYNGVEIATGAGGADFGFDMVFAAGKKLAPVVSCLAGALQVAKAAAASSTAGATALVGVAAKEMVAVGEGAGGRSALQKSRLDADIDRFWQKNDFKTRPSRAATTPPETKVARNESPPPSPTPKESFPTPSPSPTPKPESKSTTSATSAEAGRTLSRNGIATPPLVDNTENALGAREKLSAVSEKDIVVNPDFTKSEETVAAPPPSPVPEATKDVPPAKTEETQPTPAPTPSPQPQPAPAQAGQSPIGFYLGLGLEINYLPVFPAPELIMPGLDALKGLFDIVNKLEAGALVDADIMFFNIVGVGVETGIRYHMLVTQDMTFAPVFNHLINIPIFANIRLSLFVAFVQVYGGVYIPGGIINGNLEFHPEALMYEMGAKAGVVLGGLVLYATISLSATSIANLFTTSSYLQVGGGLAFKIF